MSKLDHHDCEPPAPWEDLHLKDLPEEQVNQLALDLVDDKIYTDRHVDNFDLIPQIFLPIALGALANVREEDIKRIGFCYSRIENKNMAPRTVNGHPIFWSVAFVNQGDAKKIMDKAEKIREARKKAEEEALK